MNAQSSNTTARRRNNKTIVLSIVCVAVIAVAIVWCAPWIEFEIIRLRTRTAFVVVSYNNSTAAFTLDEKQTRDVLNVVADRTRTTRRRMSVLYRDSVVIVCKDNRSECFHRVFVHRSFKSESTESTDVIDELMRLAVRGEPEEPSSHDGLFGYTPLLERVF